MALNPQLQRLLRDGRSKAVRLALTGRIEAGGAARPCGHAVLRALPLRPGCNTDTSGLCVAKERPMSINSESDIAGNLQIGPTTEGMVRLYVEADGVALPFDFDPEEADEIAEEIRAAAQAARSMGKTR